MWQLFRPFPPLGEVTVQLRELVSAGVLIQRELIEQRAFSSAAEARGLSSFDRTQLEKWDQQGMGSPLCFVRGRWSHWHLSSAYPIDGIEFRDEIGFRPWSDYEFQGEYSPEPEVTALYSEWQLLYVGAAEAATYAHVPAEVLLDGGDRLVQWTESLRWFIDSNVQAGSRLHGAWFSTIRLLLRLQARYWPF